jgi:hypothetical protein
MSSVPDWFKELFAGWSSNNAQGRESSPYRGAGLGPWSVGAGVAPTIYDQGGLPADVVNRGRMQMQGQMPQYAQGRITDMPVQLGQPAPLPPPGIGDIATAARRWPAYDYEVFDRVIAPHVGDGGITEGPNRNIDDETRMKALQWVLSQKG